MRRLPHAVQRFAAAKACQHLEGNKFDNWTAPNITNDGRVGLGKWSVDDIVLYLKTCQTATTFASGPMVEYSTSKMPDTDLKTIATYRKDCVAASLAAPRPIPGSDRRMAVGQAIYTDTCSACRTADGAGIAHTFLRLAGSVIAAQDDPSLIRIITAGGRAAATATSPAMPSLRFRLNDDQIAAVVSYVRNSWGNAAALVAPETQGTIAWKSDDGRRIDNIAVLAWTAVAVRVV
ncbi:mono/diheme cytochrome c family protein [Bradyrhizobium sp. USDA 4341]